MPVVHEALLVTNTGNTSITVSRIDANCNCTLPAQKDLPFRLAPHHVKSVEVELRKADYNVQMLNFGFETEFGRIPAQTLLTIVPRTIVTPSTVMTGVEEGETAEIEFSFREVAEQGKNTRPVGSCRCDGIHCTIKSETEAPGPADGLHFRETRIVAKVIGTTPGIHDATLLLKEKANEANVLGKAALRYECRRYVSCMPEKAYLAQKELRVFLRCRDGGVGVAKIAFVPDGIRAVLTGPREIIVFPPTNNSTRVVGDIVVETTSARQKTLRIPVVHSPTPPSGE